MRIILILAIVASAGGFLVFHKYTEQRCAVLKVQLEKEKEKSEELQKKYAVLEQKLQLESLKLQEMLKKQEQEASLKKNAEEQALREQAARLKEEKLKEKTAQLEKLKAELEAVSAKPGSRKINTAILSRRISFVKNKINQRNSDLKKIAELVGNKRFACFDMCINGTDVKFTRKMTRTCKVTVSGGIYFCEHYDMTGSDFCTRHLKHHRNWNFPNRYRDDHESAVRYLCRAHKTVWDAETAAKFRSAHNNSRAILGNQIKYRNEVVALKRELFNLEREYKTALSRNNMIESANRRNSAAAESKRNGLQEKISALEAEIEELNK